jgi:MYXO-CTERM domain-containing protein
MLTRKVACAVLLAGILAAPTIVMAQTADTNTTTADDRDDAEWGWVGLVGLLGLLGLRRRDRVDVATTRRTTT